MASEVGVEDSHPAVFIGREWELAQLRAALCEAQAGRGQLFVVSGEAGIGKMRLVGKLADCAGSENVRPRPRVFRW
ncbi:MAG: ATP-binding protein [Pseudonocardiaceae bacterium]